MNFLEAVKILEKDCCSHTMYIQGKFDKRLHLVNDELHYVEKKLTYENSAENYIPTIKDMLTEDWVVEKDQIIDGVSLNSMIGYEIVKVKYSDNEFTITLSNNTKYIFTVNNIEGSATIFKV